MAYTIPQIIGWMAVCQPLARQGEATKRPKTGNTVDIDLDIKLYITRRDLEYEFAQDPTSENLFAMGNYGLALCGIYLFRAISATGGGAVTPVTPVIPSFGQPSPYDFEVTASTFIVTGQIIKYFPATWIGWNLLFIRGSVPQSITVPDFGNYFEWDTTTAKLTLLAVGGADPAAQADERFQLYPIGGSASGSSSPGTVIVSPIRITGADFANATQWDGANSGGVTVAASYTLQVFLNDIPRFLEEGVEWQRTSAGFEILLAGFPGFNATTTNLNSVFYISMSA